MPISQATKLFPAPPYILTYTSRLLEIPEMPSSLADLGLLPAPPLIRIRTYKYLKVLKYP